jgi:hypothetical protein
MTVMSQEGLAFFTRMEKYNPAGPPPRQTIFMWLLLVEAFSNQQSALSQFRPPKNPGQTVIISMLRIYPQMFHFSF